jgi:hypothetical protein
MSAQAARWTGRGWRRCSTTRTGDTLAVVRLDRLGRSLAELLATVTMLKKRGIALLSRRRSRHVIRRVVYLTTDAMPLKLLLSPIERLRTADEPMSLASQPVRFS